MRLQTRRQGYLHSIVQHVSRPLLADHYCGTTVLLLVYRCLGLHSAGGSGVSHSLTQPLPLLIAFAALSQGLTTPLFLPFQLANIAWLLCSPPWLTEREPSTIRQGKVLPETIEIEADVHVDPIKQSRRHLVEVKQTLPLLLRRREVVTMSVSLLGMQVVVRWPVHAQVHAEGEVGFRLGCREAGGHGALVAQLGEAAREEAQHVPVAAGWVVLVGAGEEEGGADAFDELGCSDVSGCWKQESVGQNDTHFATSVLATAPEYAALRANVPLYAKLMRYRLGRYCSTPLAPRRKQMPRISCAASIES